MEENKRWKSVKGFDWVLNTVKQEKINQLIQKLDISEIIARILAGRNVELNKAEQFLNPTLRDSMPDPLHLLDMEKGANIIAESLINKENIVIFGDYDVDGATSCALLKRFFKLLEIDVGIYIPDRIGEGYGPSIEAFSYLKEQNTNLIITVDCGTAAFEAIEYGTNAGLKIVVVDHHLSPPTLPPADAVINPNRFDEQSEYKYLAAVGVAFLLTVAITSILRKKGYFLDKKEPQLLSLLDIVAIGTICDVVPLEPLNRAFVTQGLKFLNKKQNPGVQAFCRKLNIENNLTPYHLGYVIGPRINAGGRVGESSLGAHLLSTDCIDEAMQIIEKLELYNSERKAIEYSVYEQALEQAKQQSPEDSLIMVMGENWHPGVVGIVAGRLKELMHKPVAVISLDGENAKASCRSINGVDFGSAVVKAKENGLLLGGGGHKMAAGFTAIRKHLPEVKAFLHDSFTKDLSNLNNLNEKIFDAYLSVLSVNLELAKKIEQIGPFGPNNQEPRFILHDIYVAKMNIFAENHINCFIGCSETRDFSKLLKANAFRAIDTEVGNALLNSNNKKLSLIGYIRINRWRNRDTPEFYIEDVIIH